MTHTLTHALTHTWRLSNTCRTVDASARPRSKESPEANLLVRATQVCVHVLKPWFTTTECEPEDDALVNKRRLMSGFFTGGAAEPAGKGCRLQAAGCTHPHNRVEGSGGLYRTTRRTVESVFQPLCGGTLWDYQNQDQLYSPSLCTPSKELLSGVSSCSRKQI